MTAENDTMTLEQARELAREIKRRSDISYRGADVEELCDLILSDAMTREIENTAYERARDIAKEVRRANADIPPKQNGWEASFTIAKRIGSLIQPPALKAREAGR